MRNCLSWASLNARLWGIFLVGLRGEKTHPECGLMASWSDLRRPSENQWDRSLGISSNGQSSLAVVTKRCGCELCLMCWLPFYNHEEKTCLRVKSHKWRGQQEGKRASLWILEACVSSSISSYLSQFKWLSATCTKTLIKTICFL